MTSSCSPATCGSSDRPSSPPSPAGSSTPTRRSCRRSRAPTPSRDALAHGVGRHRRARSTSSTPTLDGGPIVAQEAVPILPGDDEDAAPRADPRGRAPPPAAGRRRSSLAGALAVDRAAGVTHRPRRAADARCPARAGRCCRSPTRPGLAEFGRGPRRARLRAGLDRRHGPGAARRRPAGHRRGRRHRLPGDARRAGQDAPPAGPRRHPRRPAAGRPPRASSPAAAIAPFELVVVNLYPFAAAAERPGHHASTSSSRRSTSAGRRWSARPPRTTPTSRSSPSPARYDAVLAALDASGERAGRAPRRPRGRGVPPHRRLRRPDRRGAARRGWPPPASTLPDEPGLPGADDPYPAGLTVALEKVETLRYGENPHQPAARYRRPARRPPTGPFATGGAAAPGQGAVATTTCSTRSAAAALGRAAARPGRASSSSTPTRAAPRSATTLARGLGRRPSPAIPSPRSAGSSR